MEMDDLPGVSFAGIPSNYLTEVPVEAQRILTTAFPDARLLWNAKIWKMQIVTQSPGIATPYFDGQVLQGWALIPGDIPKDKPGDAIVSELRAREHFATVRIKEMGYADMNAYLDDVMPGIERALTARFTKMAEETDRYFNRGLTLHDGVPMAFERSRTLTEKEALAKADAAHPNKHLRTGKKSLAFSSRRPFVLTEGGVILPN